jgi:hypothetical protein
MALHADLPRSPYAPLDPAHRWFPAHETLRASSCERLLPPLVARIREQVKAWRDTGYAGTSDTSRTPLRWWFDTEHLVERADGTIEPFRWYFAQREAVESVIWLYDAKGARDKFDLLRKMARLAQWCDDATAASLAQGGSAYRLADVDQDGVDRHPPSSLAELMTMFREYQPEA